MRLFFIFLAWSVLFLPFIGAGDAFAQTRVVVRGGDHDGYTRMVFEWPRIPSYTVNKNAGSVQIVFNEKAQADLSGASSPFRNVKSVQSDSANGKALKITLGGIDGHRVRDFVIGNKLVLDVYDDKEVQASAAKEPAKAVPAPAPKESALKEKVDVKSAPKKAGEDFSLKTVESAKPVPAVSVEAEPVKKAEIAPHTISFTTLTNVGIAVYTRHGYLWIVTDSKDTQSAPVLDGEEKEKFGTIEETDITAGRLYKMALPEGARVGVEGGGLTWKITLGSNQPDAEKAQNISSVREGEQAMQNIVLPFKAVRKSLSYQDPFSGDTVKVFTVGSAGEVAGAGRYFVDFDTLDSYAGLALVPKRDDVKVESTTRGIEISGGANALALSRVDDMKTKIIRKSVEEPPEAEKASEENSATSHEDNLKDELVAESEPAAESKPDLALTEAAPDVQAAHDIKEVLPEDNVAVDTVSLSKAANEKPTGNNIYNFPKWEMGGVKALQDNMHALMAEVAAKPKQEQTEDVITMAKLLLANNRAHESLGMLRIALQQVPELEGTAEFDSLKAAAQALAGKYDEAIVNFSREDLKGYDDVSYWRAYTLAGLQDWKQAGLTLPQSVAAIESYPKAVRTPLLLSFAEIALRNAREPQAKTMLGLMQTDLSKMSLPYVASWNYLAGEAERQAGNTDKAKQYWEPLINKGKDDLFRAKAGLSLTKLQIEKKTISAKDAINRLEGLRYAWRGDELETLINYRLGQFYIDNKDYLKGLTVLRNASTLTEDLQINQDVKNLMMNSFRDVFVNDRLSQMSPIDAISFYEEFKDLTPPGNEGEEYVEKLAERLVDADLLGRAASLLEYQVNNRLQGNKKAEVAIRLAAIRLLDGNPDGALRSLEIAQNTLDKISGKVPDVKTPAALPAPDSKPQDVETQAGEATQDSPKPEENKTPAKETVDPEKQRQIYLLKARALSMKKKPDEALAILEGMRVDPDVNRLRTDIAWMAGKWEEAAFALNDLIVSEDISPKRPLTDYQRDLILNRAIALNLSGNRVALANLRERYNTQMNQSEKGKIFDVVTRPRRPDMIGSREAIESMISEIDLFKGFLDSYAKSLDSKKAVPAKPASQKSEAKPAASDQAVTPNSPDAAATSASSEKPH